MKTIAMMTLLLGTIAVGIAPAAEARDDHDSRRWQHARQDHEDRGERHYRLHARQVREIQTLTNRLERATDEGA